MTHRLPLCGLALLLAAIVPCPAGEARVSVYVLDRALDTERTGGACLPYSPQVKTGPSREILALAKGPPGSTVFMMAFDRDAPHLNLAPVLAGQTESSEAARFPAEGATWPFTGVAATVDLYVAVFEKGDPQLAKFTEYADWLNDALREANEVDVLLHAEAIRKRLSRILRERSVEDYRVKFGDGMSSLRLPPSSKAAVTRGPTDPLIKKGDRIPKSPLAAVRRGLKTLHEEWQQDSRPLDFGLAKPGVLVFPISTPVMP